MHNLSNKLCFGLLTDRDIRGWKNSSTEPNRLISSPDNLNVFNKLPVVTEFTPQ